MCQLCLAIPTTNPVIRTVVVALIIVLLLVGAASLGRLVRHSLAPNSITSTMAVRSAVDGATYRVHGDLTDPRGAADLLAELNRWATKLVGSLRRRYLGLDGIPPTLPRSARTRARVSCVRNLVARYNPDNFVENSYKGSSSESSYCVDKGAILAICLRSRVIASSKEMGTSTRVPPGQFQDLNTLFFVTLHELTHMTIEDIDHPRRFWSAFRFILIEAELAPVNFISPRYAQNPVAYCGVVINYNPRYDRGVASIDSYPVGA